MALTELIAATADAATSSAITLSGPTQIVADDLTGSEEVAIHRERKDGTFEAWVVDKIGVVLTSHTPSIILEGYCQIKAVKPATSNSVAVSYAS